MHKPAVLCGYRSPKLSALPHRQLIAAVVIHVPRVPQEEDKNQTEEATEETTEPADAPAEAPASAPQEETP